MEQIKEIIEKMGYTTRKGIGSEFEIFVNDKDGNSITCVLVGTELQAVSNRDIENNEFPERYAVDATDEDAVIIVVECAMQKDRNLKK